MIDRQDELYHYGVLGMKWGVHRAESGISKATSKEQLNKSKVLLGKHMQKTTKKLQKLDKQHVKLQKQHQRNVERVKPKIATYERMAARHEKKSRRLLLGNDISNAYHSRKAANLYVKASRLQSVVAKNEARLAKNERIQKAMSEGYSRMDKDMVELGKKMLKL